MKVNARSFPRLVSVPVLTLTLLCSFAYFAPADRLRAVAAQSASPSGSFGFLVNASQTDSAGGNGGALLGLMNFDGAGNVSGSYTLQSRGQGDQTLTGSFTGTTSSNPDGSGSVTLALDAGLTVTFAMVVTDGGQGFQLMSTSCPGCNLGGGVVPLRGTPQSLTGTLPIGLVIDGASGNIPLTLSGVSPLNTGGATVYTATVATGSGTLQCPDGSAGNWTASVPALTVALNPDIPYLATNGGGGVSGNFLLAVFINGCGNADFETRNGLVTGNVSPGGATSLNLHASPGVISGIARAVGSGSLSGSYGFQLNSSPFPAGTIGVVNFDGAGKVAVSLTSVGEKGGGQSSVSTANLSGTYSVKPDGSGTINLPAAPGQSANATFAFTITDGGSGLLLLQTSGAPGGNLVFGTARQQ